MTLSELKGVACLISGAAIMGFAAGKISGLNYENKKLKLKAFNEGFQQGRRVALEIKKHNDMLYDGEYVWTRQKVIDA